MGLISSISRQIAQPIIYHVVGNGGASAGFDYDAIAISLGLDANATVLQHLLKSAIVTNDKIKDERPGTASHDAISGACLLLDGTDDLIRWATADIGTLYASYYNATTESWIDASITHGSGSYDFTVATGTKVTHLKLWTDNTATIGQKQALEYDAIPANLWSWLKLEESSQTTICLDSSGLENHAILNNADLTVARYLGSELPHSHSNVAGYTLSDGVTYFQNDDDTGLIASGVIIPRDESNPTKCVAYLSGGSQADLQYSGKAKRPGKPRQSLCLDFDGSTTFVDIDTAKSQLSLAANHSGRVCFKADVTTGNRTILAATTSITDRFVVSVTAGEVRVSAYNGAFESKSGAFTDVSNDHIIEWDYISATHTLSVTLDGVVLSGTNNAGTGSTVGCRIGSTTANTLFFDGHIVDVFINGGSHWWLQDGGGSDIARDASGIGIDGTLNNFDLSAAWSQRQDVSHHNLVQGFSEYWESDGTGVGPKIIDDPTALTDVEISFEIKTTDLKGMIFGNNVVAVPFIMSFDSSNSSTSVSSGAGTSAVSVGGVSKTQRDTVQAAIGTGEWVSVVITGADLSGFTNGLFLGGYATSAWYFTGSIRKLIVDGEYYPGVRIPADASNPALDVDGNALSNPAGAWHNAAETLIDLNPNDAPALHGVADNWSPSDNESSPHYTDETADNQTKHSIIFED